MPILNTTFDLSNSFGVTLSNGNLTATYNGSTSNKVRVTNGKSYGRWYFEIYVSSGDAPFIGIASETVIMTTSSDTMSSPQIRAYYGYSSGSKFPENSGFGASYGTGSTISVLLDLESNRLEFWKNGISQGVSHTNLNLLTKKIYPYITSGNTGASHVFVANFGSSQFRYNLPSGYLPYNYELVSKTLIKNNGQYLSYNGTDFYIVPTSSPTEADFLTYGFDENIVPVAKWQTLVGNVEVYYWTDNPNKIYTEFDVESNPINLLDEIGNTPKLLYYTDEPNLNPILTTEIEPCSISDVLGENPSLLYYTDDNTKTSANMEITANYSLIDEIDGDFDIVTWTDELASDVTDNKIPTYSQVSTGGDLYTTTIDLTKGFGTKTIL